MAEDTTITPLNFNDALIGKSLNDKKTGLDIIFGYLSGMPPDVAQIAEQNGGIGIALMDRGFGQHELDLACQKLSGDCLNESFDILITKSDLPFDTRWYLIGDINALIETASLDRITLPFSDFLYKDITEILFQYL